jgi:alcohol dehydrogenase (NADP+)
MTSTPAFAVPHVGASLTPTTIERRDLRPDDVRIDIAYTGICHSDIHQAKDDWGGGIFPMVPGHEIAGTVSAVGSDVAKYQVGDRVGVGCMVNSCGECEYCRAGTEQFCLKGNVQTYNGVDYDGTHTNGGYSRHIVAFRTGSNSMSQRRCCVPASPPIPRCTIGASGRPRGSLSSAWAALDTWE